MDLYIACHIVMHISNESTCSTRTQVFQAEQEQCFLFERLTPFIVDFFSLQTCYIYKNATQYNKGKAKAQKAQYDLIN